MKLLLAAAIGLCAGLSATPALATPGFSVNFETAWAYGTDVNGYYNGGTASDGTSGANLGVQFVNVTGLSNDSSFTYYSNAPSPLGVAYAHDTAYINIASGLGNALRFFYSSPVDVIGAIRAYSGLNGMGTLLGTFDLLANAGSDYATWTPELFKFAGVARSFDLSRSADFVAFDNIAAVPEPETLLLLLAGGATALVASRRKGKVTTA